MSKTNDQAPRLLRSLFSPLAGKGVVELRAISVDKTRRPEREWVTSTSEAVAFGQEYGAKGSNYGVYFGVCKRAYSGAGTKSEIIGATALWADIDVVSNGWDMGRCLRAVHEMKSNLQPSSVVLSGGGLHLYWFLDEAHAADKRIEDANVVMGDLVSGDTVHDVTRILRLPGSFNNKRKPSKLCEVVYCYDHLRHNLDDLIDAALSHKTVMFDGCWMGRKEVEKKMAGPVDVGRPEKAFDVAKGMGSRDLARSLDAMWADKVRHKPGRGKIGIDEAVLITTARLWCSMRAKKENAATADGDLVESVVNITMQRLDNFNVDWDSGTTWPRDQQKKAICEKVMRWIPKWTVIQKQAEKAKQKGR